MLRSTTTFISVIVTLATLLGVTLHESKLDKLVTAAVGSSILVANHEGNVLRSDAHTHVDRVSLKSAIGNSVPTNRLRTSEFKQYVTPNSVPRGHHPFDNYLLPVIA